MLAIWIFGVPMKWGQGGPHNVDAVAHDSQGVSCPRDAQMATPIPTEEIGETIIAAKDIPIKTLITNGCSLVKVMTIVPIKVVIILT